MTMKDLTHVERSLLPWRRERITECGLDASRHPTWTREAALTKAKEYGRQRFSLFVCMTCWQCVERHATWDEDPASCMVRHAEPMRAWGGPSEQKRLFADELRAIAALIETHREEYDHMVKSFGEIVELRSATARARLRAP